MITLRFISQPQDIAAVVQLAHDPNCEIFRAVWRARQRLRFAWRRIYYFLATVFFSIAVLASYRFYWHINPTLPNIVIVFSFLFYYLFSSLPLFVPFLIKKIFCGHKSNEAHYTDFLSKCQKTCAKKLKKSLSESCYYTLFADSDSCYFLVNDNTEKKGMQSWCNYLCSIEDDHWLIIYYRLRSTVHFTAIPKKSSIMAQDIYQESFTQFCALRPDNNRLDSADR